MIGHHLDRHCKLSEVCVCKGQDKSQNKQAWYIIGRLCKEQEKSVKKNPFLIPIPQNFLGGGSQSVRGL